MKSFITYLILFISTILLYGCKKYPEDGKRSWHKPEKRIVGVWYLKEYYVDEIDSSFENYTISNTYNGNFSWQLINAKFTFSDKNLDIYLSTVT